MSLFAEIQACTDGAHFHRADLHIHSYGDSGSYDVTDATMTPETIVDTAIAEHLHVISITDHNQVGNVGRALTRAAGKHILVIPGVELSTTQGHLLVYCDTLQSLQTFIGKLDISPDRKFCNHTIPQCLKLANEFGAIGIAAHVDLPNGFHHAHPKFDPFKQDILNCENLVGLEVSAAENEPWFSHADTDADRRNCVVIRCNTLELEEGTEIAKVMGSDAHTVGALGRNARGDRRLTRLKMASPTFEAFRIALIDCSARVRLEDLVPESIPHFVGMKLEGGFLNGQTLRFSKNLTCIIGGRGAGKSTMLESLRVSSGNNVNNSLVDCEVWPDSISLIYQDEVGQQHVLTRSKLRDVINTTAPTDGPTRIGIESYGQGETAETIQHCDRDPNLLLAFLDEFIDLADLRKRDAELRTELLNNQTEIERLLLEVRQIPEIEKLKTIADKQLEALKQQNAAQVVDLEQKLATERTFRDQLTGSLSALTRSVKEALSNDSLSEMMALDGSSLVVGKAEFEQVKKIITDLAAKIAQSSKDIQEYTSTYIEQLVQQLKAWKAKEQETQKKIEDIRRDLEKKNIRLDIAFIRKVTKDSADYAARLVELRKRIPLLQQAQATRRALLKERREIKSKAYTIRLAFARGMNQNLAATVVDYRVSLKFYEGLLSNDFEELIKTEMNWRTSQVPRAKLLAAQMSPFALLDAVDKKDTSPIMSVKSEDGSPVFSKAEAGLILVTFNQPSSRYALERVPFADRPEIKVTKEVTLSDGKKAYPVRDFSQLSLGQQQSILLSIMLFSKSKVPLIIDQPEDNLDSEFIYKTLVRTLRSIKEQRQVIIVTHNANIAVLGDAELILPLRAASEYAVVRDPGSIDTEETKELVCTILEGSRDAFRKRQAVYGY